MAEDKKNSTGKSGLPEKITIGGVEYVVKDNPQLLGLIAAGRTEAKNTLYAEIKTLNDSLKALKEDRLADVIPKETYEAEKKKLEDELLKSKAMIADLTDKKPDPKVEEKTGMTPEDIKNLVQEQLAEQQKALTEKFEKDLAGVRQNLGTKVAGDYRSELLEKNKGRIIPELLKGETVEELNANLKDALEISKNYITVEEGGKKLTLAEKEVADTLKEQRLEEDKAKASGYQFPPSPSRQDLPRAGEDLVANVKELDVKEFDTNRDAIMRSARLIAENATKGV